MDLPLVFHIGPASLSAHLLFETLAFFIGFRYFLYLRKQRGDTIREDNRIWIFIGATAGALLGSRILGALESPSALAASEHPLLYVFSSKTIVGGLLGGLAGVETVKKIIGETRSSGDLFTYPLMLGMIIGRIGCFLNGTAESVYGLPATGWYAMDLGDGIPRHPVALYEIIFLILLWLGLRFAERRRPLREGCRFQLFMVFYLGFRMALEAFKPTEPLALGLSAILLACLAGWIYYRDIVIDLFTFKWKAFYHEPEHP